MASYIPLAQISPDEFIPGPATRPRPRHSFPLWFSRRRALLALIALSSLVSLAIFIPLSLSDDEIIPLDSPVNPNYQPTYIAIPVPDRLPPGAHPRLRPVRDLPSNCLEQYYAAGQPCHDGNGPLPMDVFWTWVNGSDPLIIATKQHAVDSFSEDDPDRPLNTLNPSRMYRDHDELRYSIRSVLANYRPHVNRFRIITSDVDYPEDPDQSFPDPGPGYWRLGLQPQWLQSLDEETPQWKDGDVHLSLTHHAHIFEPYNATSFNSYAIESQFGHLQDVSDTLTTTSISSVPCPPPRSTPTVRLLLPPVYGTVMRIQADMTVGPDWPQTERGEWKTMGVTNWLLSACLCERFGRRRRPYIQHQAKAVSFPVLQELSIIWKDWTARSASHRFRETEGNPGDIYEMFLFAHFLVERNREALLWAWAVGRIGGLDDSWSEHETTRAWIELGGGWDGDAGREITVESGLRETIREDRLHKNLRASGVEPVDGHWRSTYHFSSQDGYAYNPYGRRGEGGWPGFEPEEPPKKPLKEKERLQKEAERARRMCTIKREECFGVRGPEGGAPSASEVFKRIAFEKTECGDCIITALVRASGPLGLSAFLPDETRRTEATGEPADESWVPHLPLVEKWQDGRYALRDVMRAAPDTSVREWAMRLMQRYRYIIAGTWSAFERMESLGQTRTMLARLDKQEGLTMVCINDDLNRQNEEVTRYFRGWQQKHWPRAASWEVDAANERRAGNASSGATPPSADSPPDVGGT
ncbi:uncharacterized protein BXZ73DRAFT_53589 [Epithele typhae]|uniref:uncharacterized protein n=1 Tax=Epithele typhae TaxID=378194 RepID=UPI002008037E|nr:uncharacterized protein BXZ73DRAFT_53589 [Epithele typhae]KAH9916760.1 hypothetical protein BXZ73DRAFT_53589 [Epithele typhae]